MVKKYIKRYIPDHNKIKSNPQLNRVFGRLLHDPNLLHLNRHSVTGATFIGLFMAFMPMPFQMVPAAALAIYFRVNLPISIALVWISNPITMPPIFYFCYLVGTWILRTELIDMEFHLSIEWLSTRLIEIWQPFLLGCFIVASVSAIVGAVSIRLLWRLHIVNNWKKRKLNHKKIN
ncbi:FIG01199889: hypothetical protein [hydrothermal vent metagenome]|uniref:DUF2062 domain-containing protein n=1 Tax=hydrothermal vent metagenome TaxID=652676 RepID=A0A3B1ADG3_9ZZZZ